SPIPCNPHALLSHCWRRGSESNRFELSGSRAKPLGRKNAHRCRSADIVGDAESEIKPTTASKRLHFRAPRNTVGVRSGVRRVVVILPESRLNGCRRLKKSSPLSCNQDTSKMVITHRHLRNSSPPVVTLSRVSPKTYPIDSISGQAIAQSLTDA